MGTGVTRSFRRLWMGIAILGTLAQGGSTIAPAADWTQWRGPGRDGRWLEPGLDRSPASGGFTIRWHAPVGFGFSSPVVASGRVFVTDSQFPKDGLTERALCLDVRTGHTLWTHAFRGDYAEWAHDPANAFGPRPTPLVHQDRVFILGARGQLFCLDATHGSVRWHRSLPNASKDSVYTASPVLEADRLILSMDGGPEGGSVRALDASTGQDLWRALSEPPTMGSPVVVEAAGRRQLIVWTSQAVHALDPKTGAALWRVPHPGGLTYPMATPVWEGSRLLVGGLCLTLGEREGTPEATVLWPETGPPSRETLSETSHPWLESGYLYTANLNHELACLDARTGRVLWTTNSITPASSATGIQITRVGPRHLLLNDRGELIWAQLDPAGYREGSRTQLLLPTSPMGRTRHFWTPAAFANGCLFVRNDEEVLCARLFEDAKGGPSDVGDEPRVVELWPGAPPDEVGNIGPERHRMSPALDRSKVEVTQPTRLITGVRTPTLTIHRPAPERDTGTAVLICPGGGYWDLYWQLEGEEVAAWLNSIGVTGVILKYRVPRRPGEIEREPARRPLQDAQRAIRLLRSRSPGWGWNLRRLGVVGFSAGGHLAFSVATRFDEPSYPPLDEVDTASPRPDFAIPVYSGYLKVRDRSELSPDLRVSSRTPPCFLVHGEADIISPSEGTLLAFQALQAAGVPSELHLYAGATHDFGVRADAGPAATWTRRCEEWMRSQGWLE